MSEETTHRLSVVIPVYRGERTLEAVVEELATLTTTATTADGHSFTIDDVILVHDCGPDRSDRTIEALAQRYPFVRPVWLSRNYGQHPATLAGMAGATGDWVVTMDEDGQQNPGDIGALLDTAVRERTQVVYGQPGNPPPHGVIRNTMSRAAKRIAVALLGNRDIRAINSFRLISGEIARSLAAYCGNGVFLDVALFWIAGRISRCPVTLRGERGHISGYSLTKLLRHFWQLLLTSGTRPLRLITVMGGLALIVAVLISGYVLWLKWHREIAVQGWASTIIVVTFFSGVILTSLGIIAEYLAVTMSIVMGKPLYVITTTPTRPRQDKRFRYFSPPCRGDRPSEGGVREGEKIEIPRREP